MEDLVLKYFGFLIGDNKNNLQHITIKAGWHEEYYLKAPNCILCISIDYQDDDAYLSIIKETEKFNNLPIKPSEMYILDKDKKFLKKHNSIYGRSWLSVSKFSKKTNELFKFYADYLKNNLNSILTKT
ncbi:hypothetical protein LJC17_04945 [Acholeplasma sp. OttesenSCG-928-E16]|nr:hypothetical protein [Acholeplasma sp. OttesenSCG-928-E16]